MKGIHQEDTVIQDLITELRKEFGMVHDDFYMVLTDADMKIKVGKQSYCCCASLTFIQGWGEIIRKCVKIKETIK